MHKLTLCRVTIAPDLAGRWNVVVRYGSRELSSQQQFVAPDLASAFVTAQNLPRVIEAEFKP